MSPCTSSPRCPRATRRACFPANARVRRFVPHGPILDRAACAITHGGMGATQKALARGVPVCAVPFGRDQFEVARRVEVAGAGARLPAKRLSPKRLRAAVKEAIRCEPGARRIAASYRKAGGPVAAADALEELIRSANLRLHPAIVDAVSWVSSEPR